MLSPDSCEAAMADALWTTTLPVPQGIEPILRFNIHRNNVYAGLVACLKARFPVVMRLVGGDFFTHCARVFIERLPPQSPVLLNYGGDFPDFVASFDPARGIPYLAGVARLEWLRHTAQHGPNAVPLDSSCLTAVPVESMNDLVFDLHPTCQVMTSSYPVLTVWRTNTFDAVTQVISEGAPGESVLIVRPHEVVQLLPLGDGADIFMAQLQQGAALGHAAAIAQRAAESFDLVAALTALLRAEAFTAFHLHPATRRN